MTKNKPTPAVHITDAKSRSGGLRAEDTTGRGVHLERIETETDIHVTSSPPPATAHIQTGRSTRETDHTTSHPTPGDFLDLEIHILQRRDEEYPVQITLGGEQVSPQDHLPAGILPWTPGADLISDGHRLFDALFARGVLRDTWMQARGQSAQRRIRLRIDPNAPELHTLPWELLRENDTTLSTDAKTPFSRYLPVFEPWGQTIKERPIRVLVVISNPADLPHHLAPLDTALERSILEKAFHTLDQNEIQLHFFDPPVTMERLQTKLHQGYHILHYLGHGTFSKNKQHTILYMQDSAGNTHRVRDQQFSQMLSRQRVPPRLIFLAACQSAARSTIDTFLGLAPKLVTAGVPAIVAMQDKITTTAAPRTRARTRPSLRPADSRRHQLWRP